MVRDYAHISNKRGKYKLLVFCASKILRFVVLGQEYVELLPHKYRDQGSTTKAS